LVPTIELKGFRTSQKGPQYPREKNKGKCKKGSGGNEKKYNKKFEGEKGEKKKVKFP
jgi:hypothetical protein